jgi:glycosyltransferase involved in cell wall biosynthesis
MGSGIADYTAELVPFLAGRAAVDVFCPRPGWLRARGAPRGARVMSPGRFFADPDAYDGCFYHLGNNPDHEFVYAAARRRPEIAVFHDAVLHHLIAHITVEQGAVPADYRQIITAEHGDRGGRLAVLKERRLATDFEKFLFPLTSHVARQARGIVVHNIDAATKMREAAPDVPIAVIPHHAGAPPRGVAGVDRSEARRRTGLPADAFVVGHIGFITRPKQPGAVVQGFAGLLREIPTAVLLMVGADRTSGALMGMVRRLGIEHAVRLTGYVNMVQMYEYLRAIDVSINLRYPSAGESSGTLARSLAEGRVVIVNNYASWAELPADVALKVEIDRPPAEQVAEHLIRLARDPTLREALGARAREYAREHLDPSACAAQYVAFARAVKGTG